VPVFYWAIFYARSSSTYAMSVLSLLAGSLFWHPSILFVVEVRHEKAIGEVSQKNLGHQARE